MNITPLRRTVLQLLLASLLMTLATGCAYQLPRRPWVNLAPPPDSRPDCSVEVPKRQVEFVTPVGGPPEAPYTLHFVEFDDQGWTYPDRGFAGPFDRVGNPSQQLECALADLRQKLARQEPVALYLYVHGWHHNAGSGDSDITTFRQQVLKAYAEEYQRGGQKRHVVGIYVGWEGETIRLPGLSQATFFSRKNAAHRVADGRLRELFARIRALRQVHNKDCARIAPGPSEPDDTRACRLRTVMIGHSFGGLILYSAIQPYLLETLSMALEPGAGDPAARVRSIADLVVLLNPAFQASLHEAIHAAAAEQMRLQPDAERKPLLVSLTSTGDWATRRIFPAARKLETLVQYPPNTDDQREALRDTLGNVERYLTHDLCRLNGSCRESEGRFPDSAPRPVCGNDLVLRRRAATGVDGAPPRAVAPPAVWNVRTYDDIIADHNAISGPFVARFLEWVYGGAGAPWPDCELGAAVTTETAGKPAHPPPTRLPHPGDEAGAPIESVPRPADEAR